MDWREFIKYLLEQDLVISSADAEQLTGIRQPIIDRCKSKPLKRKVHRDSIRKLQNGLKIKIDDSDPQNITYKKIPEEHKAKKFEDSIKNFDSNSFPVVSIVRAGQPNGVREDDVLYYAEFNYAKREGVIAVMIEGDSMETEFKHGDLVLADKYIEPINGDVVIAVFNNNEHTIKKFRNLVDEYVELIPVNKNYQNQIVHKSKISAIYTVVRSYRNHR